MPAYKSLTTFDTGNVSIRIAVMGLIDNNVYLISDGAGGTIVVDPAIEAETIVELAGDALISAIFVTHNHWDHVGALAKLHKLTDAPVYASVIDSKMIETGGSRNLYHVDVAACPVAFKVDDGDEITVGETTWKVMLTPGHTPGSICFLCTQGTKKGAPVLLSGDTLFYGATGRTDFPGGIMDDMLRSLRKLAKLSDDILVLPGHEQLTAIGAERKRVIEFFQ